MTVVAPLSSSDIRSSDFDILASDQPSDVYATYEQLRSKCPVARSLDYDGFWALTAYSDVKFAADHSDLYISRPVSVIPTDPRGLRRPPLNFDAPDHTPYKTALDRTLKPARLIRLKSTLEDHARTELLPLLRAGKGDVCEFGARLAAFMETEWLNLGADAAPVLADTATAWVRAWREMDAINVNKHSAVLYQCAADLIEERRSNPLDPLDDPASSLLSEVDASGLPLDQEHLVGCIRQCLVVGTVAPPIILGSISQHLAQDLDLQTQLRNDPSLIVPATEEFVRLYTPYRGFARSVAVETVSHGRLLRPEEPISLCYAAANRDPSVFPEPDKFILNRPNIASHLGFGRGRHRCVGMPLARLALQVSLRALLEGTASFKAADEPVSYARMPEMGLTSFSIELTAAS